MNIKDRILFEDNHILVVNKKAGELVQGDKTGDHYTSRSFKGLYKRKIQQAGGRLPWYCS